MRTKARRGARGLSVGVPTVPRMRLLHTSDWHIGRTFHTHPTLEAARTVLGALAEEVRARGVDAVLVAGDVFDSAMPSAEAWEVFEEAVGAIRAAGAQVVLTSGNHDSIVRLGLHARWTALAGVHLLTRHERLETPVTLTDAHGAVQVYGIPYLEPALLRSSHPERRIRDHEDALGLAMDRVRADLAARGGRSVVLSHCFAAGVAAGDVERDIVQGGLGLVPAAVFDGPDYVALGHIHGRAVLTDRVRYSGAPLHYSFAERGKPRGAWIVDLDAHGLRRVEWLDLPIPRRLSELTGPIEHLLAAAEHVDCERDWVKAVVTDTVRPIDGMRRLQARFPDCVAFEWRPAAVATPATASYGERIAGRTDPEVIAGFLEYVRGGVGPTTFERQLVERMMTERSTVERSA